MSPRANSQKVTEKRVVIMTQALDADWFVGRRHRRLHLFDDWRADVWIHDSGHAVIFSNRRMAMTEILSSQELELPVDRVVWQRVPTSEDFATIQPGGSLQYQFNYELETTEPSIFRYLTQEMLVRPSPNDLVWQEIGSNRWTGSPLIRVHVSATSKFLAVQSFHTFPQELSILRTQSLFEIQN